MSNQSLEDRAREFFALRGENLTPTGAFAILLDRLVDVSGELNLERARANGRQLDIEQLRRDLDFAKSEIGVLRSAVARNEAERPKINAVLIEAKAMLANHFLDKAKLTDFDDRLERAIASTDSVPF